MKKSIALLLALLLCLSLFAACGKSTPTGNTDDSAVQVDEDTQNPVMNFIGDYINDRCSMTLLAEGALGAKVTCRDSCVTIRGVDPGRISHPAVLPCRECGSTLRFMLPVCLMSGQEYLLTGSGALFKRPLSVYEDICKEQNLHFERKENSLSVAGKLSPGQYVIPGNISSQFVSGLLFVLPLLEDSSTIRLLPPIESRPYIDMTLHALAQFGIKTVLASADGREDQFSGPEQKAPVQNGNNFSDTASGSSGSGPLPIHTGSRPLVIHLPGRQKYLSRNLKVEGDYSNAAFFDALTLLGGNVEVDGLEKNSLQGDQIYREYFARLQKGFAELDLSDCPDLGPLLMAVAAALHGGRFTGTRRLAFKESDRGAAMQQELGRMHARADLSENEILVYPGISRPQEVLDGHNDHRIVMALSVLLSMTGGSLRGAEAVAKSLPDFFTMLKSLGIKMSFEKT